MIDYLTMFRWRKKVTLKPTAIFNSQTETTWESRMAGMRLSIVPAHWEEVMLDAWPQGFHLTQVQMELTWQKGAGESQTHQSFLRQRLLSLQLCHPAKETSSWARDAESGTKNGIAASPWKIPPNICAAAGFPKSIISFHWSEWICSQNSCRSVYITHGLIHYILPEWNIN